MESEKRRAYIYIYVRPHARGSGGKGGRFAGGGNDCDSQGGKTYSLRERERRGLESELLLKRQLAFCKLQRDCKRGGVGGRAEGSLDERSAEVSNAGWTTTSGLEFTWLLCRSVAPSLLLLSLTRARPFIYARAFFLFDRTRARDFRRLFFSLWRGDRKLLERKE